MQKSRNESLANHIGPESCTVSGNAGGEALTGMRTGWVLSREVKLNPGADVLQDNGRQHCTHRYGKVYAGPARSETPRMYRDTLHGNREALHSTFEFWKVRMENPMGARP
jgi:RNA-directed DNA polymerase